MWHGRRRRRLGLVTEHREALLRNLVIGLVDNSRIETTYPRAKEASRFADKIVTIAKTNSLHSRRVLFSKLHHSPSVKKLVDEIAPLFKDVPGGYTRVLRSRFRAGDGAQMALLEFTRIVERPAEDDTKKKKKKKEKPEGKVEAPEKKTAKPKKEKPAKAPREEKAEKAKKKPEEEKGASEEKKDVQGQEEPKKGGFLGNLRKFLKGD